MTEPDAETERRRLAAELERLRAERAEALDERRRAEVIAQAIRDHDRDRHTADQDAHLAVINGSIERTEQALKALDKRLAGLEAERAAERKVNAALSDHLTRQEHRAISNLTLWIMTAAVIAAIIIPLLVAIIKG